MFSAARSDASWLVVGADLRADLSLAERRERGAPLVPGDQHVAASLGGTHAHRGQLPE